MRYLINGFLIFMVLCAVQTANAQSETTTFYHHDALGSIVAASDENGDIIWRKTYDPYGNEVISTESGEKYEGQAYTGQQYDKETGLLYLNQRYYNPKIRQFMSMDPVGFTPNNPVSFNPYAYANNNPYRYVDPDGRQASIGYTPCFGDDKICASSRRQMEMEARGTLIGGGIMAGAACLVSGLCRMGLTAFSLSDPSPESLTNIIPAAKGLAGNPLFKSALGQFKNTPFTNAGRAVTKHAEYFGFKNAEALRKVYNTEAKINKLAVDTLKSIMRSGKTTTGAGGRYPNGWKTITGADGRAASWHADGRFIGFRGIQ